MKGDDISWLIFIRLPIKSMEKFMLVKLNFLLKNDLKNTVQMLSKKDVKKDPYTPQ